MISFLHNESHGSLMDLPYVVRAESDHVVVELFRDAMDHPFLTSDTAEHILGVGIGEIRIDCAHVQHANSVMIAWIIRVVNALKPRHVALVGVSDRQAFLLRRMRLDQLVEIRGT
jgi:anti-anti-sigma regulatory factor